MDSDAKFYTSICSMVLVFAIALVLSITGYYNNKNNIVAQMVKDGVSPVAISCALDDSYNQDPKCMVLATLSTASVK